MKNFRKNLAHLWADVQACYISFYEDQYCWQVGSEGLGLQTSDEVDKLSLDSLSSASFSGQGRGTTQEEGSCFSKARSCPPSPRTFRRSPPPSSTSRTYPSTSRSCPCTSSLFLSCPTTSSSCPPTSSTPTSCPPTSSTSSTSSASTRFLCSRIPMRLEKQGPPY